MASQAAAKRYAEAIFDLAREEDKLDEWLASLNRLVEIATDETASRFFNSPNVPDADKNAAMRALISGEGEEQVLNLARLLIHRRRFDALPLIASIYQDMMLEASGVAVADVTTAIDLSDEEMQRVAAGLQHLVGRQVEVRPKVDPDIIGGFVARVGDQLVDGSVRSQLRNLRAALTQR